VGLFKTIAEGGQIWAHRVRMVRQVARIAILASLAIGIVFFAYRMAQVPKVYYQSAWYYGKAQLQGSANDEILVSSEFWSKIERHHYSGKPIVVKGSKLEQACKRKLILLWHITKSNLTDAGSLIFKTFCLSILFFLAKGGHFHNFHIRHPSNGAQAA